MSDHADTIRSSLRAAAAWGGTTVMVRDATPFHDALAALDALLAERAELQRKALIAHEIVAERQQAIDALREAEEWAYELGHEGLAQRLSAALGKLGEQP